MASFKSFLLEKVEIFGGGELKPTEKDYKDILYHIDVMKNTPIIWRGFKSKNKLGQIKIITNDGRGGFRGKIFPSAEKIIKGLKIKNVAFGTYLSMSARFFGLLYIMIPIRPFVAYQSNELKDIAGIPRLLGLRVEKIPDNEIKKIIKSYEKVLAKYPYSEVIFDIKKYYLISVDSILNLTKRNKFRKIKSINDLKTYVDVKKLVLDYKNQIEYLSKRREGKK